MRKQLIEKDLENFTSGQLERELKRRKATLGKARWEKLETTIDLDELVSDYIFEGLWQKLNIPYNPDDTIEEQIDEALGRIELGELKVSIEMHIPTIKTRNLRIRVIKE